MTIEATFTPIGRHKIKAIPARCSRGQALYDEWKHDIKFAPTWQESHWAFLGKRKYDKHRPKCAVCTRYELWRVEERKKIR